MNNVHWMDIKTAPVGEIVIMANLETGNVAAGYGEWTKTVGAPPRYLALDESGLGFFKPTHWCRMPVIPSQKDVAA
jgi:hypothetical protein